MLVVEEQDAISNVLFGTVGSRCAGGRLGYTGGRRRYSCRRWNARPCRERECVKSRSVCGKLNSSISGEREFETENMRAIRVE